MHTYKVIDASTLYSPSGNQINFVEILFQISQADIKCTCDDNKATQLCSDDIVVSLNS